MSLFSPDISTESDESFVGMCRLWLHIWRFTSGSGELGSTSAVAEQPS